MKKILFGSIAATAYLIWLSFFSDLFYKNKVVFDVSRQSPVHVTNVTKPKSLEELQEIVQKTANRISFAGGRFSQGGQIAYPDGIVIDTTGLNKITNFNPETKTISVQPGVRWSDIQKLIDPYDLSVKVMQSYNDFTVGGSLSVNVHGRDPLGSLIKTVKEIKVMQSNGQILNASRTENPDLFFAAIGGYGLLGPIVEATLQLTDNGIIEREIEIVHIDEYPVYFFANIYNNDKVAFHNANIYPNAFKEVLSITWLKSSKELTNKNRLQKKQLHLKEKIEEQLLRRISPLKKLREQIEPYLMNKTEIVKRNYEMSYTVESLEPLVRFPTTSILQEYFIPKDQLISFIDDFRKIVHQYGVNVLNVSIRYVPADTESILAYSPKDSFALVCYINVIRSPNQKKERVWTQKLVDAAINRGGTFYLPYHIYATKEQFKVAYPKFKDFLEIKNKYDPVNKFVNSLYKAYF